MKKPKKKMKGRKRGGASHPCPKCGSDSEVIITKRDGSAVLRKRQCLRRPSHKYATMEQVYD